LSAGPGAGETDLASRWVGGNVVAASDESFGEKEYLLEPGPARWEPGRFGPRGELVQGWETRRRRGEPGDDWVIVRLGAPGMVTAVDVDTTLFTGNHPQSCRVEATGVEGYPGPRELQGPATTWETLVPETALRGDEHNLLPVTDARRWTHLRLWAHPDGGVARLRVYGRAVPDPRRLEGLTIDLAGREYGGLVVDSSDDFYSSAEVLNRPDRARTMGEGWETRRRRGGGHDWVLLRLALLGVAQRLIVDTSYYRYNASSEVSASGGQTTDGPWAVLLERTALQPDTIHEFNVADIGPVGLVRIEAYPDGGLSRLRLPGRVDAGALATAARRWWDSLPAPQAYGLLTSAGADATTADELVAGRPDEVEGWSGAVAHYLGTFGAP